MSSYEWIGGSQVALPFTSDTHNVQIAEIFDPNITFIRAIITLELVQTLDIPDPSSLPTAWGPVVVGLDWRGIGGATDPRVVNDGGGDWSLWRGIQWTQSLDSLGPSALRVTFRNDPQSDFIDVRGERQLAPYVDPQAVLWLSVGNGLVGLPDVGIELRTFTMAYTARVLLFHP